MLYRPPDDQGPCRLKKEKNTHRSRCMVTPRLFPATLTTVLGRRGQL